MADEVRNDDTAPIYSDLGTLDANKPPFRSHSANHSVRQPVELRNQATKVWRHPFLDAAYQHNCAPGGPMALFPRDHATDCVFVKIVARHATLANTAFHERLADITGEVVNKW